jgi:hypothetical protein
MRRFLELFEEEEEEEACGPEFPPFSVLLFVGDRGEEHIAAAIKFTWNEFEERGTRNTRPVTRPFHRFPRVLTAFSTATNEIIPVSIVYPDAKGLYRYKFH